MNFINNPVITTSDFMKIICATHLGRNKKGVGVKLSLFNNKMHQMNW